MKAEDFDPIDEQAAEVHDGHRVELASLSGSRNRGS